MTEVLAPLHFTNYGSVHPYGSQVVPDGSRPAGGHLLWLSLEDPALRVPTLEVVGSLPRVTDVSLDGKPDSSEGVLAVWTSLRTRTESGIQTELRQQLNGIVHALGNIARTEPTDTKIDMAKIFQIIDNSGGLRIRHMHRRRRKF